MLVIVTHHAHHPEEGVYRLMFAVAQDVPIETMIVNDDFDPELDVDADNQPMIAVVDVIRQVGDSEEIVWADDDERWANKTEDEIRDEQREQVRQVLEDRAAERPPEPPINEFDGIGDEL